MDVVFVPPKVGGNYHCDRSDERKLTEVSKRSEVPTVVRTAVEQPSHGLFGSQFQHVQRVAAEFWWLG